MHEVNGSTIYQRPDGSWVIKRNTAERPSSVHRTLQEAERFAMEMLKSEGGGMLITTLGFGQQVQQKHAFIV